MASIPLNKFEKCDLVIKLHKEGKTYSEIAHIAHVSLRDIKPTLRKYERNLETKKGEVNNQKTTKKRSKRIQAYDLFRNGKTPIQICIDLRLDFHRVRKYWKEFLLLQNMKDLYNIYIENEYHLDYLLHIYFFMLRNKIPKKDCEIVLQNAATVITLNNSISNLKLECETWQRVKNNHENAPLEPLPKKINWNYHNYHF
jgi:transposase